MIPFLSTTFYVGPAAEAMNGADISFIVGLVVSGGLYLILWATPGGADAKGTTAGATTTNGPSAEEHRSKAASADAA
jgi:hypothetical protein